MRLGERLRDEADEVDATDGALRKVESSELEETAGGRDRDGNHTPPRLLVSLDGDAARSEQGR